MPAPKPPSLEDHERRIESVEGRLVALTTEVKRVLTEFQHEAKRIREDWKAEHANMTEGAKHHLVKAIEAGLAPLAQYAAEVRAILVLTKDQTALLMDAQTERLKRAARDELDIEARKRAAEDKAIAAAAKADAEVVAESAHKRRIATWGVVIAVLTVLSGLATAAIASHH